MKYFFILFLFLFQHSYSQKIKKADKPVLNNLQAHVNFLADDKLEGRRAGTAGEKMAYEYIISEFTKAGLSPKGENGTYLQEFEIKEGSKKVFSTGSDIFPETGGSRALQNSVFSGIRHFLPM